MKKIIKIFIFSAIFFLPAISYAAGLAVTPQSPFVQKNKVIYLPDDAGTRDIKFKVRYCGNPLEGTSKPESTSSEAWVSYSGEQPNTRVTITNIGKSTDPSSDKCTKAYYGDIATINWTLPDTIQSGSLVTINIRDSLSSYATITFKMSNPPTEGEESKDPDEQVTVEDTLSFGNISDIMNGIGPNANFLTPEKAVETIVDILLMIAGIFSILAITWCGWLLITSGGDTGKAEKAKKGIIWSATGLLVIIFAEFIVSAVKIF